MNFQTVDPIITQFGYIINCSLFWVFSVSGNSGGNEDEKREEIHD